MKGDAAAIHALARKPRPDIRLYLIFGTDDGGNASLAAEIIASFPKGAERTDLDGPQLARDPSLLAAEAASLSLFGDARYIRVSTSGKESLPAVEALSESVFREVFGRGLVAAVHVGLYDPRFGAPTVDRLASPEGRVAASDVVFRCVQHRLGHDAPLRRALLSRLD